MSKKHDEHQDEKKTESVTPEIQAEAKGFVGQAPSKPAPVVTEATIPKSQKEYVDSSPTAVEMVDINKRSEAEKLKKEKVRTDSPDEMSNDEDFTGSGTLSALEIARVAHAVSRAYGKSVGEDSLKPWDEEDEEVKKDTIANVKERLENSKLSLEDAHSRWLERQKAAGWEHGDNRDSKTKKHPNMLPYHALPQQQQVKDILFATIVQELKEL